MIKDNTLEQSCRSSAAAAGDEDEDDEAGDEVSFATDEQLLVCACCSLWLKLISLLPPLRLLQLRPPDVNVRLVQLPVKVDYNFACNSGSKRVFVRQVAQRGEVGGTDGGGAWGVGTPASSFILNFTITGIACGM